MAEAIGDELLAASDLVECDAAAYRKSGAFNSSLNFLSVSIYVDVLDFSASVNSICFL